MWEFSNDVRFSITDVRKFIIWWDWILSNYEFPISVELTSLILMSGYERKNILMDDLTWVDLIMQTVLKCHFTLSRKKCRIRCNFLAMMWMRATKGVNERPSPLANMTWRPLTDLTELIGPSTWSPCEKSCNSLQRRSLIAVHQGDMQIYLLLHYDT